MLTLPALASAAFQFFGADALYLVVLDFAFNSLSVVEGTEQS